MRAHVNRHRTRFLEVCLLVAGAGAALAFWRMDASAHPSASGVTWTSTTARLLAAHCGACHAEGGASPRLDDYSSARAASRSIKQAVLGRHLQWFAVSGFAEFAHDPTLTPHETEQIARWVDDRAPLGEPATGTAMPAPVESPDLVLMVPSKHRIQESSHTFRLPTGQRADRVIRGWRFQPGNPARITGAVLALESGPTLGTWVPGEGATFLPPGVTRRLPSGVALLLTVYYRKPPGPAVDASAVALFFAPRHERELERLTLPCGSSRLPAAIDVLAIRPPAGAGGRTLTVVARGSGGRLEPMGRFQDYPAGHPRTYWYREPIRLARGMTLDVAAFHADCGAELEYVRAGRPLGSAAAVAAPSIAPDPPSEFWCPMHPAVRGTMRGTCGQCGMTLIPMSPSIDGPYGLDVDLAGPGPGRHQPALRLAVREPGSNAIVRRFETLHERAFHLFVVSDDLREFFHVHPVARADGSLELSPVPWRAQQLYQIYADFLPVGGTPQLIRKTLLPPRAARLTPWPAPQLMPDLEAKADHGLRVRLELGERLVAGQPSLMTFHLEDVATGAAVTDLEPYLGAWGHAFVLSGDRATAGSYRVWVQFKRQGQVATVPFTVVVME
jgi:hypothetical protein